MTEHVDARIIYPFRTMKVGEEFFAPGKGASFRVYVYHRAKALGRKFIVRADTRHGVDGMVVERVRGGQTV
jgi:hypothetical protein